TYYGGTGTDGGRGDITLLEAAGSIIFSGATASLDLPGALTTYNGGRTDGFVTRLSGSGDVVASTYIGGSADDESTGVAVTGKAVVLVGNTSSTDFPLMNPFQGVLKGQRDPFVVFVDAMTLI